ncbi:MAG: hypothetical protein H0W15_07235 [Gemmatimonadales bacterium]|nr:hypothetical protein [Gemmatimonadales bacterium]
MPRTPMALVVLTVACTPVPPSTGPALTGQSEPAALRLERELTALGHTRGPDGLWPGFDPVAVPLAVFDGNRTWLFRHPSPPEEFAAMSQAAPTVQVMIGRHDAVAANSSAEIGGVATATVILAPSSPGASPPSHAALAVHEAFHVFQRARHPAWAGNEADLFVYSTDNANALALRRLESAALRVALDATGAASACWAHHALVTRGRRFGMLDSASIAYERGTELNEGLASYVERKVRGDNAVILPADEYGPADVRVRAYATGLALAVLLDRHAPGWVTELESSDRHSLDELLSRAVATGQTCSFPAAAVDSASQRAIADVDRQATLRASRLEAFRTRDGWRVIVESPSNALWPQGFDPINVERLTTGAVLHRRFLKVGNDAGMLTMLDEAGADLDALTEGHGTHPLFNGIVRVEVAGLAEPLVEVVGDTVRVRSPGVSAEFRGATVNRSGRTVRVRMGP